MGQIHIQGGRRTNHELRKLFGAFQQEADPVKKALYEQKIVPKGEQPHFAPLEEGIKGVRNDFYGFFAETSLAAEVISKTYHEWEKCQLRYIRFFNFPYATIPIRKNSFYGELVKIG